MTRTHFGYQQVDERDKSQRVRAVFDSVAGKYDLMNDLMSLGLHRVWKAYAVAVAAPKAGERVLDIAGGTGDLTACAGCTRRARPAAWCTPTSTPPCWGRAATGWWTRA